MLQRRRWRIKKIHQEAWGPCSRHRSHRLSQDLDKEERLVSVMAVPDGLGVFGDAKGRTAQAICLSLSNLFLFLFQPRWCWFVAAQHAHPSRYHPQLQLWWLEWAWACGRDRGTGVRRMQDWVSGLTVWVVVALNSSHSRYLPSFLFKHFLRLTLLTKLFHFIARK